VRPNIVPLTASKQNRSFGPRGSAYRLRPEDARPRFAKSFPSRGTRRSNKIFKTQTFVPERNDAVREEIPSIKRQNENTRRRRAR